MSATPSDIVRPAHPHGPNPAYVTEPEVNPVHNSRGKLVGVLREVNGRAVFEPLGDRCPACRGPGELIRMRPNMLLRHRDVNDRHACRVASWKPGRPL